jgi:hypothetical protein
MRTFGLMRGVLVHSAALCALLSIAVPSSWASGQSKSGASIAQARVDGASGNIDSFGGKGTVSAVSSGSGGFYFVTFNGHYPADINSGKVILQTTCNSGAYGVSNSYVSSATPTQINVGVYCWTSSTLTYVANDVFVNVYAGQ